MSNAPHFSIDVSAFQPDPYPDFAICCIVSFTFKGAPCHGAGIARLPRNRLKQPGLSRPVAGLQEPTTHVGGDYALIVANRNRVLRLT